MSRPFSPCRRLLPHTRPLVFYHRLPGPDKAARAPPDCQERWCANGTPPRFQAALFGSIAGTTRYQHGCMGLGPRNILPRTALGARGETDDPPAETTEAPPECRRIPRLGLPPPLDRQRLDAGPAASIAREPGGLARPAPRRRDHGRPGAPYPRAARPVSGVALLPAPHHGGDGSALALWGQARAPGTLDDLPRMGDGGQHLVADRGRGQPVQPNHRGRRTIGRHLHTLGQQRRRLRGLVLARRPRRPGTVLRAGTASAALSVPADRLGDAGLGGLETRGLRLPVSLVRHHGAVGALGYDPPDAARQGAGHDADHHRATQRYLDRLAGDRPRQVSVR